MLTSIDYFTLLPTGVKTNKTGTKEIEILVDNNNKNKNNINTKTKYDQKQKPKMEPSDIEQIEAAAQLMRKYLNETHNNGKSWLLQTIIEVLAEPERQFKMHKFRFEKSIEAAEHNAKIIQEHNYDFVETMKSQSNTVLTVGTEFRKVETLEKLLKHRNDWNEIKDILSNGVWYPMKNEPDEETRLNDLKALIERGNHKSASSEDALKRITKIYGKEINKAWLIPLPIPFIPKIKEASVIPCGLQKQKTVDRNGKIIDKYRLTHDLSFPGPSGNSINKNVDDDLLTECYYGQCLRRVIHMIVALRIKNPTTIIYLMKYDFDAAYRRLHVNPLMAVKAITIIEEFAYLLLRLPFGASPGPSKYSSVSEMIFELTMDILQDNEWDPKQLHSIYYKRLKQPEPLPPDTKFDKAVPLAVKFPTWEKYCDGYIDDAILIALDKGDNIIKCQNALPLAADVITRPVHKVEMAPRDESIQNTKLEGEGTPAERKVILGWLIDTRSLRIYLPIEKTILWIEQINEILKNDKKINAKELEKIIGRLNHAGFILPVARYFLNRLRHKFQLAQKYGPQNINDRIKKDLILWKKYLTSASQVGVSLNLITYATWSTKICTDACEHGIGGWNTETKIAWRLKLPDFMIGKYHINFLEFLAAWIGIWIELLQSTSKYERYLCLTDNTCALGWLYKANFCPEEQEHNDIVARKMAEKLMEKEATIFSQHIKGCNNVIADSLSRDHHLSDKQLTFVLNTVYPEQTNKDLTILQTVPKEITSFLRLFKDGEINPKELQKPQTPSKLGAFVGGNASWRYVISRMNSLIASLQKDGSSSCQLLQAALDETRMGRQNGNAYKDPLSEPPFLMYARPSGRTYGGTRC